MSGPVADFLVRKAHAPQSLRKLANRVDKMIGCELELAEILLARRLAPIAIAGAK